VRSTMRAQLLFLCVVLLALLHSSYAAPRTRHPAHRSHGAGRTLVADLKGTLEDQLATVSGMRFRGGESSGSESGEESSSQKPLYVLPMVPMEWKQGNLLTNPFQNAIDPKVLENGWTPGMEASAKGLSPNPNPPSDQSGIPVQSFLEGAATTHSFSVDTCINCRFDE